MNQELHTFYGLAKRTRALTLDWLETLPLEVFTYKHADFAYGSLSRIYAHIADCYLWWISAVGLNEDVLEIQVHDVSALRDAFVRVDSVVAEALERFTDLDAPFTWNAPTGYTHTLNRRWLFLHPITHEFHHKGQALALARVLGHPHHGSPDSDLVEPVFLREDKDG